jgi:hypothetical protein
MSLLVPHWWGWVRHIQRPIAGVLQPYLDRYTLRRQHASGTNPWRIYLHHFLARDAVGKHNHPSTWSIGIPVWGSYTEEVLHQGRPPTHKDADGAYGCEWVASWVTVFPGGWVETRRVRWWNYIPASKYHEITELHPGRVPWAPWRRCRGVWTLFICGPLTGRGWGFFIPGRGHVDHTELEHTKVTTSTP